MTIQFQQAHPAIQFLLVVALLYLVLCLLALVVARPMMFPAPASSYDKSYPTVTLRTVDGLAVAGLFLENSSSKLTLLFSHGNGEDIGYAKEFLEELRDYARLGEIPPEGRYDYAADMASIITPLAPLPALLDAALRDFTLASGLNPTDPDAWSQVAVVRQLQGDLAAASEAWLQAATRSHDEAVRCRFARGCEIGAGRFRKGVGGRRSFSPPS